MANWPRMRRCVRSGKSWASDITDVRLLGVLENIYSKDDKDWHEIVFMFEARFVDGSLEAAERLVGMEGDGDRIEAVWLDVSEPPGCAVVSARVAGAVAGAAGRGCR